jgi:site-specific recombinase XerD
LTFLLLFGALGKRAKSRKTPKKGRLAMHEIATIEDCPRDDIPTLVRLCLESERDRNLSERSLRELRRYLTEFQDHCQAELVCSAPELTPDFLKTYAEKRCGSAGPSLRKAVVWALQRLGKYLCLVQVVKVDPARRLRYPKMHPRSEIPEYLSELQLRHLLEHSASHGTLTQFATLSLIAATGLRPNEVSHLKLSDVSLGNQCMNVRVKGGWIKKTALSYPLITILKAYLSTRTGDSEAFFVNSRGGPTSASFLQRTVKEAGKQAGLEVSLTCNQLRHTFATHAADSFGKVITKALMGHQHLSTTGVYTHLSPRRFKSLMKLHPLANREDRSRS